MEFSFSDATIYKFNRSNRRWKEKGYGIVSFFQNTDDLLLITLGKESFLVSGSIRPKGPNAFVMPVRRRKSSWDKQDTILAVRFGRARDSKRLSELLSDQIVDIHQLRISKTYSKSRKQPPPWFSCLGSHQKISLRSFIRNSSKRSLNDGSLTRELAKLYRLFPWQVEEAIDFFCHWRDCRRKKISSCRRASFSSDSNGWSIPPHSPNIRARHKSPKQSSYKMRYRPSVMNPSYSQLDLHRSSMLLPQKTKSQPFPPKVHFSQFRDRESLSEISAQVRRSLRGQTLVDRSAEIGPNPNTQLHKNQIVKSVSKNTNSRLNDRKKPENIEKGYNGVTPGNNPWKFNQATTKGAIVKMERATFDGDIKKFLEVTPDGSLGEHVGKNLKQTGLQTQNYSLADGQEKFMLQGEQSSETAGSDTTLQITPLTEKNLILLNEKTPPLKGDFNTIVSIWLEKSVP